MQIRTIFFAWSEIFTPPRSGSGYDLDPLNLINKVSKLQREDATPVERRHRIDGAEDSPGGDHVVGLLAVAPHLVKQTTKII
jgi:hypothetical protein